MRYKLLILFIVGFSCFLIGWRGDVPSANPTNYAGVINTYHKQPTRIVTINKKKDVKKLFLYPNTRYVVKRELDLGGKTLLVSDGCIIEFDGGILRNGTIVGQETQIIAGRNVIFNKIVIGGTWDVKTIYADWFEDVTQTNGLKQVINLTSPTRNNHIILSNQEYCVAVNLNEDWGNRVLKLKSNTWFESHGKIVLEDSKTTTYAILYCSGVSNVTIEGGALVGDLTNHTGEKGEWGMGIELAESSDIQIRNVKIKKCWGDGIYVGGRKGGCHNVMIENFTIDNCRRQGISIVSSINTILRNGVISNIYGTAPESCIDVETHNEKEKVENVTIQNVEFNSKYGFLSYTPRKLSNRVKNLRLSNCTFHTSRAVNASKVEGMTVDSCRFYENLKNQSVQSLENTPFDIQQCREVVISNNYIEYLQPSVSDAERVIKIVQTAGVTIKDNSIISSKKNILTIPNDAILSNNRVND